MRWLNYSNNKIIKFGNQIEKLTFFFLPSINIREMLKENTLKKPFSFFHKKTRLSIECYVTELFVYFISVVRISNLL